MVKKAHLILLGIFLAVVMSGCGEKGNAVQFQMVNDGDSQPEASNAVQPEGTGEAAGEASAADKKEQDQLLAGLLDSWNFDNGRILLEQVTKSLDENGIHYAGYYNVSGERIDLTLEDGTALIFLETRDPEAEYWEHSGRFELMMKGEEFNGNGFQEGYLNEFDVTSDEPMWPDLSSKEFDAAELWSYNQTDLSIGRNQLFAKYGRKFTDPFLNAVFARKNWYKPVYDGQEFDRTMQEFLTETEKANLEAVMKQENDLYYRKKGDYQTVKPLLSGSWLDVDHDGEEEQVCFRFDQTEEYEALVTLTIKEADGTQASVEEHAWSPRKPVYVCSLTEETSQLIIADDGVSEDYTMEFYEYDSGKLTDIGTVSSFPESVQLTGGSISALVETFHLQCEPIRLIYEMTGDQLKQREQEYYEYRGNEVTALTELPLYAAMGDNTPLGELHRDEKVKILGGDLSEWVKIQKIADGAVCWIRVQEGQCELPDGSVLQSSLVFDGLTFYG